jgi:hypothetical protein
LRACWLETLDPGPYRFADGKVDWGKVLLGDRLYALLHVRMAAYGAEYGFSVGCRAPGCGKRIDWELNLEDLPVWALSADGRRHLSAGNRFETTLPGGARKVWFRLLTGDDETKLTRLPQGGVGPQSSARLVLHVLEVEGVEAREKHTFLSTLSYGQRDELLAAFEEQNCGVDTTIDVACSHCGAEQEVDLPFDKGFFAPAQERMRRRRRARANSSLGST